MEKPVKLENFNLAAIKWMFIPFFMSTNMNKTHYRLISPKYIRLREKENGNGEREGGRRGEERGGRRGKREISLWITRGNPLQRIHCNVRATVIYSRASDASVSFGAVFLSRPYKRADIYTVNTYPGAIINFSRYNYGATTHALDVRVRVIETEVRITVGAHSRYPNVAPVTVVLN